MKIKYDIKRICKDCLLLPLPLRIKVRAFFTLLSARILLNRAKKKGEA